MADTIRVEGLAELQRALRAAAGHVRDLRQANRDAAELVAQEASSRAPVLSGRLAASVRPSVQARSADVKAGRGMLYAGVIHFGWRGHNIAPNPFLYDALDARRNEVVQKYHDAVEDVVARNF